MDLTIITITNRRRWHLLQKTLTAAFEGGADRAVVVDNESEDDIASKMSATFPGRHSTVRLDKNQGAAGAYFEGIKAALASGAEFLLLLDDDNIVKQGAIASLKSVYSEKLPASSRDGLCVAGFRREQEMIRESMEPHFPSPHTFITFHIKNIPARIWKRRPWNLRALRERRVIVPKRPVRRAVAPWGGLLFHRSVIERFGYPDPRFVLYSDDTEFTNRITSGGGEIWLVPDAEIEDIESAWVSGSRRMFSFVAWILRGSDEQVYYNLRNFCYLETNGRPRSWVRKLNRAMLISILWLTALRAGKMDRFRLILKAVRDGEAGRLGFRTV